MTSLLCACCRKPLVLFGARDGVYCPRCRFTCGMCRSPQPLVYGAMGWVCIACRRPAQRVARPYAPKIEPTPPEPEPAPPTDETVEASFTDWIASPGSPFQENQS